MNNKNSVDGQGHIIGEQVGASQYWEEKYRNQMEDIPQNEMEK